ITALSSKRSTAIMRRIRLSASRKSRFSCAVWHDGYPRSDRCTLPPLYYVSNLTGGSAYGKRLHPDENRDNGDDHEQLAVEPDDSVCGAHFGELSGAVGHRAIAEPNRVAPLKGHLPDAVGVRLQRHDSHQFVPVRGLNNGSAAALLRGLQFAGSQI